MKERLDAIRAEMALLEKARLVDEEAKAKYWSLSDEGARLVNQKATEVAKRFGRRAPVMSSAKFQKTYQIGRTA